MLKTPWRAGKRLLRTSWKGFKWLFLLTLPLTILPIISGIVNGLYFAYWSDGLIDKHTDVYLHDIKDYANDWGVPGGMTFREYQDTHNDFHVLRLNTNDWNSKLGFTLPREYGDLQYNRDTPINKYASLDTLMLDTTVLAEPTPPKEQWVYISDFAWPSFNTWDGAFDTAVQGVYIPSALNETRLFFATCHGTAGFLCGVWGVRAPTLLHFLVEDFAPRSEDITPGRTYSTRLWKLRPVTVRVIEFPLQGVYTGLHPDVFPGPKEQMLGIMCGNGLFEQFEPWNEFEQVIRRFQEYIDNLYDRKGTLLYYLGKTDDWATEHLTKPLGLEKALEIVSVGFFLVIAAVTQRLILSPWHWAKEIVLDYLGSPKRGDWIFGEGLEKEWNPWDGLMGGMMGAFWESLRKGLERAELEKDWPGGKITTSSMPGATPSVESSARTASEFKW